MRDGPATEGFTVSWCAKRLSRALSDHTVTMFVTTSMLPRTDFEYGQI